MDLLGGYKGKAIATELKNRSDPAQARRNLGAGGTAEDKVSAEKVSKDDRPLGNVATRILFENDAVRVWEMTLGPGERSERHRHDLPYLLCILEGSRLDAEIEGTGHVEIPVQPGSVFFVPPGSVETAVNPTDRAFREILIELKTAPAAELPLAMANVPGLPEG